MAGSKVASAWLMSAADWSEISPLFDEALELPPELRRHWLDSLPDPAKRFREALERLLTDHRHIETQDFLNTPPLLSLPDPSGAPDTVPTVGPYRLLREIGRGGMGTVWLAERSDGLIKRAVALKLPHPDLATQGFAERLARERDILASLSHPHIAPLYDAGVSAEGQPYLALALVRGQGLIDHCNALRLGLRERIVLFQQVLAAVQYAHTHLVIHRDLKPNNVMVDADGQVQLLDFGIAKLMIDGIAQETELTEIGGRALTPDYASPEQIAGGPLGTGSDVYSLGVLLFELLTGARPYRLQRGSRAEIEEAILSVEPIRPSDVPRDEPRAAARGATPAQLSKALRGDLDAIVLKALAKSATQRYSGADALAQDLARHLAGEAVGAQPERAWTRAARLVRRHRLLTGAAALLVVSLAAGLTGTAWQAREARRQAQQALAVKDFLVDLFRQADPNRHAVQDLTALEMLERGQQNLQTQLKDQPRLRAELSGVLSEVYTQLNDEAHAKPLAEARRDLTLAMDGPDSLSYGTALEALAEVQSALGDHQVSLANYLEARRIYGRHAAERRDDLAEIGGHIAFQQLSLGRYQDAADTLVAGVPLMEATLGPTFHKTLHYKTVLAATLARLGDLAGAERIAAEVLPRLDELEQQRPTAAFTIYGNLGQMLMSASRFSQAEALFRRGLAGAQRLYEPDSLNAIIDLRSIGQAQFEAGRYTDAADTAVDAASRSAKALGADSESTRAAESLAVRPLLMVGRAAEAEALARHSLSLATASVEVLTPNQRETESRLSLSLLLNDKATEAATRLEGLAVAPSASKNPIGEGRTWLYLAGARLALGNSAGATKAAERAEALFGQASANRELNIARAQITRALAAASAHDSAATERLALSAEGLIQKAVGPAHPLIQMAELARAEGQRAAGHFDTAERMEALARQALAQGSGAILPKPLVVVF